MIDINIVKNNFGVGVMSLEKRGSKGKQAASDV